MDLRKILLCAISSSIVLNVGNFANDANAAAEEEVNSKDALTRALWKSGWHAYLSTQWKLAGLKKNTWWKAQKYEDSIFLTIREAIADCITKNNEFAHIGQDDVVEFGDTFNKMQYEQKHCNALCLYNMLHEVIDNNKALDDNLMGDVYKKLSDHFGNKNKKGYINKFNPGSDFLAKLRKACEDISCYLADTKLKNFINLAKEIKVQNNCDWAAPGARVYKYSNIENNPNGTAEIFTTYLALDPVNAKKPELVQYTIYYANPWHVQVTNFKLEDYTKTFALTAVPDGTFSDNSNNPNNPNANPFSTNGNTMKYITNELPTSYLLDNRFSSNIDGIKTLIAVTVSDHITGMNAYCDAYQIAKRKKNWIIKYRVIE